MNATIAKRSLKKSPPDGRDLQIFKLAEIQNWTHDQIAEHLGDVSRRRVSQIVIEVRHWLAHHPAEDPELKTELEQKRLARNMERMHLENVITRALFALDHAPPTLQTSCHANGVCVANYHRDQPPVDVRVLKTYLRAVEALGKLNERPQIPQPELPPGAALDDAIPWQDPRLTKIFDHWAGCYGMREDTMRQMTRELTAALFDIFELATVDQTNGDGQPEESSGDPPAGPSVPEGPELPVAMPAPPPIGQEPSDQPVGPSASHASQREALDPAQPVPTTEDLKSGDEVTYADIVAARALVQILGEHPQKWELGSADDDADEPPAQAPLPVTEVQLTPDKPGATVVAPNTGPSGTVTDAETLAGPRGQPSSAQGV
jgi:hypothetical protein